MGIAPPRDCARSASPPSEGARCESLPYPSPIAASRRRRLLRLSRPMATAEKRRKEIYTYEAPWPVYGLGGSQRPGKENEFRFAVGSFVEEYTNKVQIVQLDDDKGEFVGRQIFDHP